MKIQIDLEAKTIKIDQDLTLEALLKTVKELRPTDWQEYTLQTNTVINNFTSPIVYDWPWYRPYYGLHYYTGTGAAGLSGASRTTTNLDSVGAGQSFASNNVVAKLNPDTPSTFTSNLLNYEIKA